MAKAVAFLMWQLGEEEVDELRAITLATAIKRIFQDEPIPEGLFPAQGISHFDCKFSDGVLCTYDPVNGFIEI